MSRVRLFLSLASSSSPFLLTQGHCKDASVRRRTARVRGLLLSGKCTHGESLGGEGGVVRVGV